MTFNEYLAIPQSKKITLVEIDSPLSATWINYQPGIWFTTLTPGKELVVDDRGNTGYWGTQNTYVYNINSLNVAGTLYSEVTSIALCISTNKSWYYNSTNTRMYIHFDAWSIPEQYSPVAPGAVIGFTKGEDKTNNNYFEDIYYEPLVNSVPNLKKQKDSLFFGLLQYSGGSVTFDNTGGYFDDFSTRDLYGQPIRILLSFEGLDYSDALLVFSGKVEDYAQDFTSFKLKIADTRKLLSRKLPINVFDSTTYPSMDSKLIGLPIPIAFGTVIKAPAYRTSSGNWKFADTTFNAIDATITVYEKDDTEFSHGGTETDGTFTGADTTDKLTVTYTQSVVQNGLDILSDIIANYEGIDFNETNYDLDEWNAEKTSVSNEGIWLGRGNLKSTVDIIEQVCTDNQGVFDVLPSGKFTFRSFIPTRIPEHEIFEYELLDDPSKIDSSEEFLTSVKIEHSEDLKEKDAEIFTYDTLESEVYGRYRQYKERTFESALTNSTDAATLGAAIMGQSKFIFPIIDLTTKTQNINLRILDNLQYTYARQAGTEIVGRSIYQVLGVGLDMGAYEMNMAVKQIALSNISYQIIDGGDTEADYNYYDGGDPSSIPTQIIDGRVL